MISVIIPIYDRTKELKSSIDSILEQTYQDFELILVTDGSPKDTFDVVESYRDNPKIKIFNYYGKNTGNAVKGRNKGIKEAKGECIAFQDSDDIAETNRLELSIKYMNEYDVDIVYGGWKALVDNTREDINLKNGHVVISPECDLQKLLEICVPCQSTVMVKRNALLDVGGLKSKMNYMEDYELWLRLAYHGYKFKAIPKVLTNLRLHEFNNELKFKKNSDKWNKLAKKEYKEKSILPQKIAYLIPGIGISGGIAVILQHVNRLLKKGYDVLLISQGLESEVNWTNNNVDIVFTKTKYEYQLDNIDILIATSWLTIFDVDKINSKRKIYFVQSDERRFDDNLNTKKIIHSTYERNFEYITEAKWIQRWLKKEFGHDSYYVPNGLDDKVFFSTSSLQKKQKTRVLLEGPITIPFKGVADAYQAIKDLDCEIWIVSSAGQPPKNWRYDKFFEKVPIDKMREIYSSCDIFLKMSRIEGFFGPPMEAMACKCSVVVGKCTGHDEYIENKKNALVVEQGDINGAKDAVKTLIENKNLRNKLIKEGLKTISKWKWSRSIKCLENVINKDRNDIKKIELNQEVNEIYNESKEIREKCDIIIIVHNAFEYLKKCIDSIEKNTKFPYHLIIVDNNSNDNVKEYLKTLKNADVIFNDKNKGFGYANNQGLNISESKYICFLNSDTIVTENWITHLIIAMNNKNAGLIGPVTNFVSSDIQQVNYELDENLNKFAKIRYNQHKKNIEVNRLVGFCLLTKKEIINEVGQFDERYYIGNFEDDDLGLRFIERGYKLYCASGVFIYHYGGESFKDKYKTKTNTEILETNKKLYMEKWYESKRVDSLHIKKNRLKIIYLLAADTPCGGVKIVFEQANRLQDRGHDVQILCAINETNASWFDLRVPISFKGFSSIPDSDIIIGTYFSTLPFLQKVGDRVKIHLCQGYEALLYKEGAVLNTIENNYRLVRNKIVVSEWLKSIIDDKYNIDSKHINNGIDRYIFSFDRHDRNRKARILVVGSSKLKIKGVDNAIESISNIKSIELVRLSSENDNNSKCEFHDMSLMSQEDIAKVYESCDITICNSQKVEGFCLPPLESMASGTPVITTDSGGVTDYVINNYNALVITAGNSKLIEHNIKLLLNNKNLYDKLADNGIKTAKEYYWHNKIDQLESYFYSLQKQKSNKENIDLSVCMIVKNEEEYLEQCLSSIKDIASEIIIVDTGSVDNTIKIAKNFGAFIYHYEWNDDFSEARNFSLRKATKKWILILDADECISNRDISKLKKLLNQKNAAYTFATRNYVNDKKVEDTVICRGDYAEEKDYYGWKKSLKIRLFLNDVHLCFKGKIHELIEESVQKAKYSIRTADLPIHHFGYIKRNKSKEEFYAKLGKEKFKEDENDLKSITELALQYTALNNYDEALVLWRKAIQLEPKNCNVLSRIGTTYNLLEDHNQAEKYFNKSLKIRSSEYALKHLGICYARQEKYQEAYDCFRKIAFSTNDLKTKADFAFCCNTLGKFDESILVLESCLSIDRETTISWGLIEVAYNQKGIELTKTNKLTQAYNLFTNALKINPNFKTAQLNLREISKVLSK